MLPYYNISFMSELKCLIVLLLTQIAFGTLPDDPNELTGWCLDAKHHKSVPGPEDLLHKQCEPWKQRACCTSNTTVNIHYNNLYKFNYNHCSQIKNMSENCRRHFIQDLCFYECSPNIGPWVVKVSMKIRNERFFNVPLCASDCDAWFKACSDDYTCSDKWTNSILGEGGLTPCHHESECRKFSDIFGTADNFCEKVWDHSWKYTKDSDPCMRIWFDGSKGNPNEKVTKFYIEKMFNSGKAFVPLYPTLLTTFFSYLMITILTELCNY